MSWWSCWSVNLRCVLAFSRRFLLTETKLRPSFFKGHNCIPLLPTALSVWQNLTDLGGFHSAARALLFCNRIYGVVHTWKSVTQPNWLMHLKFPSFHIFCSNKRIFKLGPSNDSNCQQARLFADSWTSVMSNQEFLCDECFVKSAFYYYYYIFNSSKTEMTLTDCWHSWMHLSPRFVQLQCLLFAGNIAALSSFFFLMYVKLIFRLTSVVLFFFKANVETEVHKLKMY